MLTIEVPLRDAVDDKNNIVVLESYRLQLEHSLVSLSKWESQFKRPFLGNGEKNDEETLWYIQAMTLTPNVPPGVFYKLSESNLVDIQNYIADKMTATWFNEKNNRPSREILTAEILYYYMIALNIPFECQTWHLNRLITLIKVCNEKSQPPKKMSRAEAGRMQREMNERRLRESGTNG